MGVIIQGREVCSRYHRLVKSGTDDNPRLGNVWMDMYGRGVATLPPTPLGPRVSNPVASHRLAKTTTSTFLSLKMMVTLS
jgi:hypothetical protein